MGNNNKINNVDTNFIIKIIIILLICVGCIVSLAVVAKNTMYYSNINNSISPILIFNERRAYLELNQDEKVLIKNNLPHIENKNQFSISMWIYIENWDYNINKYKILFSRKISDTDIFTPIIALDKYENNLIFGTTIYEEDNGRVTTKFKRFVERKIPLQKWVNIVYNISDQFVTLFINSAIKNKYYLDNISYQKSSNENYEYEVLGKGRNNLEEDGTGQVGFNGRISKVQYFAKNLNNEEIRKIYENGPYVD